MNTVAPLNWLLDSVMSLAFLRDHNITGEGRNRETNAPKRDVSEERLGTSGMMGTGWGRGGSDSSLILTTC